jgi:hypothetical protein
VAVAGATAVKGAADQALKAGSHAASAVASLGGTDHGDSPTASGPTSDSKD